MTDEEQATPIERRPAGTLTVHQLLTLAHEKVELLTQQGLRLKLDEFSNSGAILSAARNREYSIAKTAIEDARLRVARGLARCHGILTDADLEDPKVLKAAKRAHEDAKEAAEEAARS